MPVATRLVRPDERLPARGIVGVLVGFAGLVLIADPDPGNLAASLGVVFVFGSAVAWVIGSVLTREDNASLSGLALQSWTLLVGAASLHLAVLVIPGESLAAAGDAGLTALAWLGYLAVVPGALGFLVYFRLLDRLGPIEMGLIEYAIPPFAALFGWLVLGHGIDPRTIFGFLAILAGFTLVKAGQLRSATRAWLG